MARCSNCGIELLGSMTKCPKCGYDTVSGQIDQKYLDSVEKSREIKPAATQNNQGVVAPYATGGLVAWSIITILLCTIPGIVALVETTAINKCTTVEEQQKKISSAQTWCIVGTVLGVIYLIVTLSRAF